MDGWDTIVECRWRTKLAEFGDRDGRYGQIALPAICRP
jgi:hypothetical protein